MRPFEYFLQKGDIKKITPNIEESKSLVIDGIKRFSYHIKQDITDENGKYIVESIYESIRELLDAYLIRNGYSSYSHQAPIVFAAMKSIITDKESKILDDLRDLRNKSKYYGKEIPLSLAKESAREAKVIFDKIKRALK